MSKRQASSAAGARERDTVPEADLLTSAEYAHYRRSSLRTVERERETGKGCPYVRLGGRVLYRRADVERYIAGHVRGLGRDAAE
jgi:hypothetical protein